MEQIGILTSGRILLRDQTPEDLGRYSATLDDLELNALDPPIGECRIPTYYSIVTSEGVHIGAMAAYNYTGREVELGIRIWDREYWNKGYGTEAVGLLVDWTFENTEVIGIFVKLVQSNIIARKCYEKCGFKAFHDGMLEGYEMTWMMKVREPKQP